MVIVIGIFMNQVVNMLFISVNWYLVKSGMSGKYCLMLISV